MAAFKVNLLIEQGANFDKVFLWKIGKPLTPVNMTGYSARMQIRATFDAVTPLLSITTADHISLSSDGKITFAIPHTVTETLDFTQAVYDLEIVNGSNVRRLMQGKVTLSPNVTK